MLFGEGAAGRRPAADRAGPRHALPPGPGVVPRRLGRPRRDAAPRPRSARGRGGDRARPGRRRGLRASCPSCGCRRATSRSRRCWAGGASRDAGRASSTPPRCTRSTASPIDELLDPTHRISVTAPVGWVGPGFLIGPTTRTSSCGGSPPASSPGSSTSSAGPRPWDDARDARPAGVHAAGLSPARRTVRPEHRFPSERRSEPARLVAGRPGAGLRRVRLLAGLHHRRLRDRGAAARRAVRRLAGPDALGDANPSLLVSLGALFIVILCASLGQAVLQYGGARIRDRITWQPVRAARRRRWRRAERGRRAARRLGARRRASAAPGCPGITPAWCAARRCSAEVNEVLPAERRAALLSAFNDVVGTSFFPRYLEPFAPERIVDRSAAGPAAAARATPTSPRRGAASSRSAATTPAAGASRAPASSTRPTG